MTTTSDWDAFETAPDESDLWETDPEHGAPGAGDASPIFVDESGSRGRRLRGVGWVFGVVCSVFVAAMASNLIGTQSQAPPLPVSSSADTTAPDDYLGAPAPVAPPLTGAHARHPSGPSPRPRTRTTPKPTDAATPRGSGPVRHPSPGPTSKKHAGAGTASSSHQS